MKQLLLVSIVAGLILVSVTAQPRGFFRRSLSDDARQALITALAGPDGEYAAHSQYAAILKKFGDVQPYASIIKAEENHIAALKRQFDKYGITVPADPFENSVAAPATLQEAAKEAIASEERNVALYDEALKKVADRPDLVRVFTNLRSASLNHHLPAFKAALANDGQLAKGTGCCGMNCCMQGSCCQSEPQVRQRSRRGN